MAVNTPVVRVCRKFDMSRHTWTWIPDFRMSWPVSPRWQTVRTSPCDPNGGWLFRKPKHILSCSTEGQEGKNYFRPIVYRTPNSKGSVSRIHCNFFLCTRCLGNVHEPLPNKLSSFISGSTIGAFRRCLPSRCLAMDSWLRHHNCSF
jgi:hypothetical protein